MGKLITVHTSRTIMFAELEKVIGFAAEKDNYLDALQANVTGKKSSSGIKKTAQFLKNLYKFDIKDPYFRTLKYFWQNTETSSRPLLAFLFAMNRDYLLAESIDPIRQTKPGEKVTVEALEQNIEIYHPGKYSNTTRRSLAQNIASSWKQAGFIKGKVKNIRVQPEINPQVACFAFFLAFLSGKSGDFIWNTPVVKALCLNEKRLRALAEECARKDWIQYQYAGNVTVISFDNLLKKTGTDAIED